MEEAMSIDFDSLAQLTFQQKVCLFFLFFLLLLLFSRVLCERIVHRDCLALTVSF